MGWSQKQVDQLQRNVNGKTKKKDISKRTESVRGYCSVCKLPVDSALIVPLGQKGMCIECFKRAADYEQRNVKRRSKKTAD